MAPIEASKEEADAFKLAHGANAIIEEADGAYFVRLKKGANIYLPKALRFDRLVAGQIPTGWDAKRYGIPDDIVSQVDPVTLYTLVATVEALITSGVTDPYEFYQYVHVSEVGNTSGGGMGGMRAMQKIFKERYVDKPVQQDILQESFINTMAAWVNMLLLSSSGPIKTPVGACATAAESVDIAYDTIISGKARIVLCGGFDDFQEEGSQEFANMKATSNSVEEFAKGREPRDMCRPATDTRSGFMEAQGAGIHVVMTADLALKMGVPIRAVIAAVNTATDKNGRSVPAPGQGILTSAREHHGKFSSPLLNFEYRAKQLKRDREHVKSWVAKEYEALADEVEELKKGGETNLDEFVKHRTEFIEREGVRKEKAALNTWSHDWWKKDTSISPLKGALATFGLTVDDIGVASFHGTGTKANDYNESSALNQQMEHLGRSKGNVLPSVFQKYLTGHPKGAAAAWMLNGVLQVLETGIIPGNRNLDNTEDRLAKFKHIIYTSRTIQTDGVKAGILKSFGFGQAGGEVLVLHPDYVFAALEANDYASYRVRRESRQTASYRYYHEALTGVAPFVRVKNAAPYTDAQQSSVYLNPMARANRDSNGTWSFNDKGIKNDSLRTSPAEIEVTQALVAAAAQVAPAGQGVGVDVQLISEVNADNTVFIERNFTAAEIAYCSGSSSPQSSFAGRWAAKEAVIKAVSSLSTGAPVWTKGSAAPLAEIEVLREEGKAPIVIFHGDAKATVGKAGVKNFHNGPLKKLPSYSGWIDVETQESVADIEVKKKYEKKILEHTGIRLIEPELFNGYNPNKKMLLQEVIVTTEMAPIEASKEEADAFKLAHGANAIIEEVDGAYFVRLKKGANIYLPKALRFDRLVAGQIPTGWDAKRYGIPDDIVSQVDPVTLYTLVATVEALITSGVTDPYEFYQYVHVSEVGNTSGGGMGGMRAMQKIFKERYVDKPVQQDILQESFINTMAAWVNMLLLSSSGPIKTPVGACATAAESVDIAYDTIISGKARIVLCGGFDDFQEEGSQEFANMKATSNSVEEFAKGREPRDMCRPATDTRSGFMEAQGAGIHVIMTADLALKMGVPIRAVIAAVNTATDKNGRSVPAPGQGILTSAREHHGKFASPLLNFEYRAKQLKRDREHVKSWVAKEYEALADEVEELKKNGETDLDEFVKHRTDFIEREGVRKEKAALNTWSHDWWKKDTSISPLKGALATFGLTVDDIGVASFHGTGTKANDYNESSALNQQMEHLGRSKGNVLPSVFQKYLTGHPKGAAAAWMLNGVLQVLETGIIPGNRNLDNTEDRLAKFKHIIYTSRTIQTDGVKAGILKSFGFGQAGGEVLVLHPDYVFAALEANDYASYRVRRESRQTASYRYYHEALTGVAPFVRVKNAAPYTDAQQSSVYLNPMARANRDSNGTWSFNDKGIKNDSLRTSPAEIEVTQALVAAAAQVAPAGQGVGVDVQLISEVNADNTVFIERNFTAAEIAYCSVSSSPQSSFAGRWAAKEAVIKAVSSLSTGAPVWTKGSAAPLAEIEVLREEGKAPTVVFHGDAKATVGKAGVKNVKITISHSGSYAIAMAIAE
ncbi:UNVERIFIED_CONTAM: 3-oxoacyl-[acyl-carrier-protein] synthase [Siphonaria sp. JEL0065]|nr:3-oxoacyl-[acyl-carrier-protein] synthase [Siphonaria sp. JEL0065]